MGEITVQYKRSNPLPDWATPKVIKAMHEDGRSLRDLAQQFSVSYQTIANIIKKAETKE